MSNITVKDIFDFMCGLAPMDAAMEWDNPGLLAGHEERVVKKALVALDVSMDVINEAADTGAGLIVSHHPVIFKPIKSVSTATVTGRRLLRLIENGIAAVCMHTNLDVAEGGVNDTLARSLGLRDILPCPGTDNVCRMGGVDTCSPEQLALLTKSRLGAPGVKLYDAGRLISRVAVGGGACADYIPAAIAAGCDAIVTSEIDHDEAVDGLEMGITMIDAGHFPTEDVICAELVRRLGEAFPELEIAKSAVWRDRARFL